MKTTKLFLMLVALLATLTVQANDNGRGGKAAKTLKVDTQKSSIIWNGKKVTGEHTGNVQLSNGSLQVANNKLTGGSFEVDMTTITNTDLTDASYNAKLVGHLKSDDFFSVEKHSKATLKITKVEPIANAKAGENNYTITGDLTIKGITKPVTFPAAVKISSNQAEATAKITVDRAGYDIRYGSKSFFENLGDKMINDEFTLDVKLIAGEESNKSAASVGN